MSEDKCPVCAEHNQTDADMSMGLILTASNALLEHDKATIKACFDSFTAWDAHIAVTALVLSWCDLCTVFGVDPRQFLATKREYFNAKQAEATP